MADLLERIDARLANSVELPRTFRGLSVLGDAGVDDVAFFFSAEYREELARTRARVVITSPEIAAMIARSGLPQWDAGTSFLVVKDPYLAMALATEWAAQSLADHTRFGVESGVHPSAHLGRGVKVGDGVSIGAFCVVGDGAVLENGVRLHERVSVGAKATVRRDSELFANVVLYPEVTVGERVWVHVGTVIGSDGFGYAPVRRGEAVTGHQKIYHLGTVIVGNDVEIGANCTIDRATLPGGATVLVDEVKLDNLVHIGHNASLGRGTIVCGGTCLAGSASTGDFATIGGLVGIVNRVRVGAGAQVGALSLVTKDVPDGGTAVGNPQRSQSEHFRAHAKLNQLVKQGKKGTSK